MQPALTLAPVRSGEDTLLQFRRRCFARQPQIVHPLACVSSTPRDDPWAFTLEFDYLALTMLRARV